VAYDGVGRRRLGIAVCAATQIMEQRNGAIAEKTICASLPNVKCVPEIKLSILHVAHDALQVDSGPAVHREGRVQVELGCD